MMAGSTKRRIEAADEKEHCRKKRKKLNADVKEKLAKFVLNLLVNFHELWKELLLNDIFSLALVNRELYTTIFKNPLIANHVFLTMVSMNHLWEPSQEFDDFKLRYHSKRGNININPLFDVREMYVLRTPLKRRSKRKSAISFLQAKKKLVEKLYGCNDTGMTNTLPLSLSQWDRQDWKLLKLLYYHVRRRVSYFLDDYWWGDCPITGMPSLEALQRRVYSMDIGYSSKCRISHLVSSIKGILTRCTGWNLSGSAPHAVKCSSKLPMYMAISYQKLLYWEERLFEAKSQLFLDAPYSKIPIPPLKSIHKLFYWFPSNTFMFGQNGLSNSEKQNEVEFVNGAKCSIPRIQLKMVEIWVRTEVYDNHEISPEIGCGLLVRAIEVKLRNCVKDLDAHNFMYNDGICCYILGDVPFREDLLGKVVYCTRNYFESEKGSVSIFLQTFNEVLHYTQVNTSKKTAHHNACALCGKLYQNLFCRNCKKKLMLSCWVKSKKTW